MLVPTTVTVVMMVDVPIHVVVNNAGYVDVAIEAPERYTVLLGMVTV